jgi:hypothetical protein
MSDIRDIRSDLSFTKQEELHEMANPTKMFRNWAADLKYLQSGAQTLVIMHMSYSYVIPHKKNAND